MVLLPVGFQHCRRVQSRFNRPDILDGQSACIRMDLDLLGFLPMHFLLGSHCVWRTGVLARAVENHLCLRGISPRNFVQHRSNWRTLLWFPVLVESRPVCQWHQWFWTVVLFWLLFIIVARSWWQSPLGKVEDQVETFQR